MINPSKSKVTKKQLQERIECLEAYTKDLHLRQASILRYLKRNGINITS